MQNDKDRGNFSKLIGTIRKSGTVKLDEVDQFITSWILMAQELASLLALGMLCQTKIRLC